MSVRCSLRSPLVLVLQFLRLIRGSSSKWPFLNMGCRNSRQFGSTWLPGKLILPWRVLWKPYILSCRTKEEKLPCLKYRGRTLREKSSTYFIKCFLLYDVHTFRIMIDSPFSPQQTISLKSSLCIIAYVLLRNAGITWLFNASSSSSNPSAY